MEPGRQPGRESMDVGADVSMMSQDDDLLNYFLSTDMQASGPGPEHPERPAGAAYASAMAQAQAQHAAQLAAQAHAHGGAYAQGGGARLGSPPSAMACLLYTSPSPRDGLLSRMPSSA